MKNINFIIFFINISSYSLLINPNPAPLDSNYPFSIKRASGSNEAIVFLDKSIKIFDISRANFQPLYKPYASPSPDISCISREENGGIYYNGYYFTSCLRNENSN